MPAIQVVHPAGYATERAYVARVMLDVFLGLEVEVGEGPVDAWELRCEGRTVSVPDVLFRTPEQDWLTPASLPPDDALYGDDLLGNAFFLLTRYEEAVTPGPARDEHGRFRPENVHADLDVPLVEDHADALWAALHAASPRLERRPRHFRTVPSHDVDWPSASLRPRLSAVRHGALHAVFRDPFDTFDLLMEESERRGLRSAFYFIPEGAPYSLDDPRIRELMRRVHRRGHELGFHASYDAFGDPDRTRHEFERLVEVCAQEGIHQEEWGGRHHFLRWEPATWGAWNDAGLAYDSTLTFTNHPGFRTGCCREYPVFDLRARRQLRLRERPLVLMDTPTLDRLGLPEAGTVEAIDRLRNECRRVQGDFTVLWHNNWLVTGRQHRLLRAALGG